ncbi:transforming growth factor beta activator LRRC33 [Betta splendens]|uniref:Transforming growth factor beta activator LRRC33 n=1 Tax=Betta splendens TaxID=158456 RepID=A0A6P7MEM1_BETSP|nr:transforming growth factor beta activator LRRC33 [Betta splendens]
MPVHGPTPTLRRLLPLWIILTAASGHPQQSPCQLIQRTALCGGGRLSSVPPGLPDNTEELQLNYNHIQTLQDGAVARYPALKTLSLACNRLQRLESNAFRDSELLESLNLANNELYVGYEESGAALKRLPGLRALDLSENKLQDEMAAVLLQNLSSVEYLNLSGNLLQRLDEASLRDLQQLRELDLQRNLLFELDDAFRGSARLQRLNLAFNSLLCLVDFDMAQLQVLNASHNSIEWFISKPDANDTFLLETLDLSDNRLLFFPFLPDRSRLRNLYLSHNAIRFYERSAANATATVEFYNLRGHAGNVTAQLWNDSLQGDVSSLEVLDLAGNQVDYLPRGFGASMPALSRLRLRANCLRSLNLTSERFPGSLHELDVSGNRLGGVVADAGSLGALGNLTYVNLSANRLQRLPARLFPSLPSLRTVDLSFNGIRICFPEEAEVRTEAPSPCVDWRSVGSLKQLHLRGCGIRVVPSAAFAGLKLTHLELSDNPGLVVQQSMGDLGRTLQHLGLGNTHIQDFDFSPFLHLKYLNISGNFLAHLPPSLTHLDLRVLDARDNRLSTIPSDQASALAAKLHQVFLTGNPFNCCQSEWFGTFNATETVDVVGKSNIECEDHVRVTHRVELLQPFLCVDEGGESVLWYILLVLPICLFFLVISILVLFNLKPNILHKSIKKKCLRPTSY